MTRRRSRQRRASPESWHDRRRRGWVRLVGCHRPNPAAWVPAGAGAPTRPRIVVTTVAAVLATAIATRSSSGARVVAHGTATFSPAASAGTVVTLRVSSVHIPAALPPPAVHRASPAASRTMSVMGLRDSSAQLSGSAARKAAEVPQPKTSRSPGLRRLPSPLPDSTLVLPCRWSRLWRGSIHEFLQHTRLLLWGLVAQVDVLRDGPIRDRHSRYAHRAGLSLGPIVLCPRSLSRPYRRGQRPAGGSESTY